MGKEKKYKITFRKKIVHERGSGNFLPSDVLDASISDFCKSSWIKIERLSIKDYPEKCYITVKCSKELYNILLTYLKTSDELRHWIEVIS